MENPEPIQEKVVDFTQIPIYDEILKLVRTIDGFKEEELVQLRFWLYELVESHEVNAIDAYHIFQTVLKDKFDIDDEKALYLQKVLRMHQILALMNVDHSLFTSAPEKMLDMLLEQLKTNGGLDYLPRTRSNQGRIFEHATDTRSLLKHLKDIKDKEQKVQPMLKDPLFKISLISSEQNVSSSEKQTESGDISTDTESMIDTETKKGDLKIHDKYLEFSLRANGKADLYFHAYAWLQYLEALFEQSTHKSDLSFDKAILSQNPELKRLNGLSESLKKVASNLNKFAFTEKIYEKYVNAFAGRKSKKRPVKLLEDIPKSLFIAQISDDKNSLYFLEKLLIQLLGFDDLAVRDQAVIYLNMLYDGVDWQFSQALVPVIRCVGMHFQIKMVVHHEHLKNKNSQIFLGLSAPSPLEGINNQILTWHKVDQRNIVKTEGVCTEIQVNFGKFWKCGFYDWRLVVINEEGRLQTLETIGKPEPAFPIVNEKDNREETEEISNLAQGRFIVQAKGMKDHIFHEVQVDFQDAKTEGNRFLKRGNFETVEKAIDGYKKKGITALYLMGTLERDNLPVYNKDLKVMEYKRPDNSALAITCRQSANRMLGGDEGFRKVMAQAQKSKIKVIIDCLARISSSRSHRKYRDLMLYYLDVDGRRKIMYGTDGQAINYKDTAMLNYRKIETWNLLVDEVANFVNKYGIDGIHLDNGQAWPQVMEVDLEELQRIDVDGLPAYTAMDLLNGEIVKQNENYGYWNTNTMETYPNPFFVKLCRKIWSQHPNFMVLGECWGGNMFEHRQIILSRSGVIPRLFKLPQVISSIFGKSLQKDGEIVPQEPENVLALKKWYQESRQFLPEGSIMLQSSSAHIWPYPAYIYGKGTWAATDILYFMSDIPITFMNEIEGEVFRIGTTQIFQHEQSQGTTGGFKRSTSQVMLALKQNESEQTRKSAVSPTRKNQPLQPSGGIQYQRRGLVTVRSGSNLAALAQESAQGQDLKVKEEKFKQDIQPFLGYDLQRISTHYEHRRRLRRDKMVLRYGELIPLVAKTDQGWHPRVLAFARLSFMETAIIAINLSDSFANVYIDLTGLQAHFNAMYSKNTIIMIKDWLQPNATPTYYFLTEYLNQSNMISLKPYRSHVVGLSVCAEDKQLLRQTIMNSLERTKEKLKIGQSIEGDQISLVYSNILRFNPTDLTKFANTIGSLQENFLDKLDLDLYDLFINNKHFLNDPVLASRMVALCERIYDICQGLKIVPAIAAHSVITRNKLGPLVFCTPELGRWSTVGGLGVMVDELTQGLAQLGQEVWVISPYYEKNRKGETGYLAYDPAGIKYVDNIDVSIAGGVTLGVHEGIVNGVHVVFLHHSDIFPFPYADVSPAHTVKQMAAFGKGCLEFCCKRQIIPALCVTNDWFTGLIPGYAKKKSFGDTFNGTTFFHIVHNLEPSYEGRIFPPPHEGAMEHIHQLDRWMLVDPYWQRLMLNPSRCAILCSDQWGTVSPSYKEDLLRESPLAPQLKEKSQAFAFPNGIPVEARLKRLNQAAPDHLSAKKMIQMKYFNYEDLDDSVPLLSFVGRITSQKGVHLILDAAEHLINNSQFKINILVGGQVNPRDPYSKSCGDKMMYLKNRYPHCFWAGPNEFFTDGSVVNRGSDFGLMPSLFEPGGIVQHEFFVGGTPVIAFKTGGLKDSVFEFVNDQGNGYTFQSHNVGDFIQACSRAINIFRDKTKYQKLRENAFKSTMDGDRVCRAWLKEFYRLRGKVFVDETVIRETLNKVQVWTPKMYKPTKSFEEMLGLDKAAIQTDMDYDLGAEDVKEVFEEEKTNKVVSAFEQAPIDNRIPHMFKLHNNGPLHQQVQLCGSFDNWQTRYQMTFDPTNKQWFTNLHLKKDKYYYKYIVNGNNWVVNDQEPKEKDPQGNLNNFVVL